MNEVDIGRDFEWPWFGYVAVAPGLRARTRCPARRRRCSGWAPSWGAPDQQTSVRCPDCSGPSSKDPTCPGAGQQQAASEHHKGATGCAGGREKALTSGRHEGAAGNEVVAVTQGQGRRGGRSRDRWPRGCSTRARASDGLRWRPSCRWRARHHAGGRAAGRPKGQHPARPGLRSRAPRRSGRAPAPWPPGTRGQRTEQQKGPGRRRRDEEENGLPAGPGHVGSDQTAAEPLATRRCLAHDRPVHAARLDRFIARAPV